ncbi:MAG: DUF732 domain-containing protein [Mycobacteriaceae bacterium]|nr:DUF732 domain-containing protein [Mycobacteriaceae bacterium]MBV9641750.1 DUF732 domain-containing protein [Mycobacteriaceae bacterium]
MAVSVAVIGVAAASGTLARADMVSNSFLAALTDAGVPYNDPASATALGQSVCPMLVQPGGTFDTAAATMAANSGMARDKASLFTIIAISVYCPGMLSPITPDRFQE